MGDKKPTFVDLYWEDILFVKILPLLSIKDVFIMRRVSKKYKLLIEKYLEHMKWLNLSPFCRTFNGAALRVLWEHCTQLRVVMMSNCQWLTDDLLIPLLVNNIYITKLVLNNCSRLTSISLQPVIINCKNLKSLSLSNCGWLTEGCLHTITLHQHNLEEVDFASCYLINKFDSINDFLVLSKKIRELNLSRLTCVNDATLSVLSRSAKQLETLNITDCNRVTTYGISLVIEYCHNLTGIICIGCPQVHRNSLRLSRANNILIIPSPNTGGLTILLPRLNV